LLATGEPIDRENGAGARRCPRCGSSAAPGAIPAECPLNGGPGCPLAGPLAPADDSAMVRDLPTLVLDPTGAPAASPRPPADAPAPGALAGWTLGGYKLGPLIGQGAMGQVYRAEHLGLRRQGALKVMDPRLSENEPEFLDQFRDEARALANLVHPNVVTIHNLGSEYGYHFLEMELLPGDSLRDELKRAGPLGPARATERVREVALALDAAHRAGVVHRDVKPGNVLLAADGRAKLADFGLARRLDDDRHGLGVAGTPVYMAPELFDGEPAGPASDLYALGVMYYELLAGRPPFPKAGLTQMIDQHRRAEPPPLGDHAPDAPVGVLDLVDALLSKRPGDRPSGADDLVDRLQTVLFDLCDTAALVVEAQADLGLPTRLSGGPDRHRLDVDLPGGRRQAVFVEAATDRDGRRLLSVYSLCGPADPAFFGPALALNAELTYGVLSIRPVDGSPTFVMSRAFAPSRLAPVELRNAIREIAMNADAVERRLAQGDTY